MQIKSKPHGKEPSDPELSLDAWCGVCSSLDKFNTIIFQSGSPSSFLSFYSTYLFNFFTVLLSDNREMTDDKITGSDRLESTCELPSTI